MPFKSKVLVKNRICLNPLHYKQVVHRLPHISTNHNTIPTAFSNWHFLTFFYKRTRPHSYALRHVDVSNIGNSCFPVTGKQSK